MTEDIIRLREEISEQIKALSDMKTMAASYGFDISHYQNKEDISWDSLSIGNKTIPLEFVVMRATMGNRSADKHFEEFWHYSWEWF